jgi:endonuclease YncB( thermonuclease family)
MKERLIIFAIGFMFSCLGIMFFLHFRSVRSGDASLIKRMINAAGEIWIVEQWLEADTLIVKLPKETITVRLNAVDTPGLDSPGGQEGLTFVQSLVGENPVRVLEFRRNTDGEIVGEVYTGENLSLNEELMKVGWAWFYEPDSQKNPYYRELNDSAIREQRGLWLSANPSPPWVTAPRNTAP